MAKGLITQQHLEDIADAIRGRNNSVTEYKPSEMAAAVAAIPNSYAVADEGKVVSSGALVAQTARATAITENGTYDTTENNSVTVNVSGGTTTQESISPILPDYVSAFYGSIIVDGSHVKLSGRVNVSSTASGERTYLTIPEGYRPAGYYILSAGRAAFSTRYFGYIGPNGNVIVNCNQSYFYLDVEWVIADETVAMLYDTSKINTITGDLAIVGDVAYLSVRITGRTSSAAWVDPLLTIPSGYRPVVGSEQTVFARSVSGTTVYDTATSDSNEKISVYLLSGSFDILISGQWKIAAA